MTLAFLGLYGTALHFAARDMASGSGGFFAENELARDMLAVQLMQLALFPASLIVGLTAVFASVASISGDLDTGIMYGVITRPIRRAELVAGKFLGIGSMLVVYSLGMLGAVVGLAYWKVDVPLDNLAGAMALFALEPLILLSVALLGSSRLPTLANGVLCLALYGVSFIGGLIEQIGSLIPNQTMLDIGVATSLLMPVDAIHRKAIAELIPGGLQLSNAAQGMGFGSNATPSAWMVAYAVAFVLLVVWWCTRSLAGRDL
jgi:ABC-type transport system involved in multi-copper enzyme maturation permease subunit